jgi:hypothetical protein
MSFPPGTEMFQFPGFASVTYGFSAGYRLRGGFPHSEICGSKGARPSPQLIAACHVLHRLSVPRHPPDALKRLISASSTREAPRTEASTLPGTHSIHRRLSPQPEPPLDPSSTSRSENSFGQRRRDRSVFAFSSQCPISATARCDLPQALRPAISFLLTFQLSRASSDRRFHHPLTPSSWWRRTGSNRRPHACKARALPTELRPRMVVGQGGFEPPTSRLSSARSNQLSY